MFFLRPYAYFCYVLMTDRRRDYHAFFAAKCGKEKKSIVFLTPQEWRNLSGVNESLKDTKWIYYPTH